MTEADGKPRARLALPYRRTPALICHRRNATCPAWPSAASAPARCEPVPAPAATCTRYRRRPARGTSAGAWNNAVRTRGVSTHRDDFQKPACAERGLVRTARERWQAWSQATGAGTGGGSWRGTRRCRKTQAGTGKRGRRCRKVQVGRGRKGTMVQEGASGERQEGNDGAGRGLDEPEKRPAKYWPAPDKRC